jgi:hypothetical protein
VACKQGLPVYKALATIYIVKDAWQEWHEGFAGWLAIRELKKQWGSRWRPGNTVRVQFCWRKVIWDVLQACTARSKSVEKTIAELEQLRAGQSLNRLVDKLRQQREHRQASPEPVQESNARLVRRGVAQQGRWAC